MNFKMKALVAAVALTASMSASAAMTNVATGDSSLILTLVDNTNNVSMTVDLGFSHTTFDRNSNFSWDITGGNYADAWTTFWTTATVATTQWAVVSIDGQATASVAAPNSIFTTMAAPISGTALPSLTQMTNAYNNFATYISANNIDSNTVVGNHQTVENGASVATSGAAWAESSNAYGTAGYIGATTNKVGDATGAMDTNLSVYTFTQTATSNLSTKAAFSQYATTAGFNPYFNLSSNGALTYTAAVAAVPEADSWAMLLAGLGLMGFIARRRTAA